MDPFVYIVSKCERGTRACSRIIIYRPNFENFIYAHPSELDETASRNVDSRKICYHRGPVHKIAMHPAMPETILTSGEDGIVHNIDIRLPNPVKLVSASTFD